jgi:AraC-like DNA-binding protein
MQIEDLAVRSSPRVSKLRSPSSKYEIDEPIEITTNSGWRFRRLCDERIHLLRSMWFDDEVKVLDALGPNWLLVLTRITKGKPFFYHGRHAVECPEVFGLWLPPFSLIRGVFSGVHKISDGIIGIGDPPEGFPKEPSMFVPKDGSFPIGVHEIFDWCSGIDTRLPINAFESSSALTKRVKKLIDGSFQNESRLSEIAKSLRTNPAYMSRVVKRESGISPNAYRAQMRITHAALCLLQQRAITDVYQDVGYADLSRFYKQFRKVTTASPAMYLHKKVKKRQDQN